MKDIKIALIHEGKIPEDRRVPLTPAQAAQVQSLFPHVKVVCQTSHLRCFDDQAYREQGIEVVNDVSDCDILMGVKEVPIPNLMEGKTYLFFSHTIKKQPYNRKLLQTILKKNIRLIDYERLTNAHSKRIVAFGRFAGIVGAYNGLYTYGKKFKLYELPRAKDCFDLQELKKELEKIKLPAIKIALTGGGRVASGAKEILDSAGIRKVTQEAYLRQTFDEPVYTQLEVTDYNQKIDNTIFNKTEFYKHPERFKSGFIPYSQVTDLFIAGAFWDHRAPALFSRTDMLQENFKIKAIADITCDIEGSIPSTKKPSTIENPVYDYDPQQDVTKEPPFQNADLISVMAIDNLPSELPRDASQSFGEKLIKSVLPSLLKEDAAHIIQRATIAENGHLTEDYQYLQDYVNEYISS